VPSTLETKLLYKQQFGQGAARQLRGQI